MTAARSFGGHRIADETFVGFFGAHRSAIPAAPALFIAQARWETASGFSSGAGGGMTTRAQDFNARQTAQDMAADTDSRDRATSLLNLHARLEAARASAAGGSPLVHGVEVHGVEAQLRLLGAEEGVVGFEIAAVESEARWSRPPLTGEAAGLMERAGSRRWPSPSWTDMAAS